MHGTLLLLMMSTYVCNLILAHIWYALGFVLKTGCDRSGIRAVLTVGHEPSLAMVVRESSMLLYCLKIYFGVI